ncbi:MAG: hypothetical protein QXN49_07610 [Archaeoglobaceae archaeon]
MVTAVDLAIMHVQMLNNLFELVINMSILLTNASIRVDDLWNITYSSSSFSYWVLRSFLGAGGAFDWMRQNITSLRYFADTINYIGTNATLIFGDSTGTKGMSAVLKNTGSKVDSNFVVNMTKMLNESVKFVHKMLANVNISVR